MSEHPTIDVQGGPVTMERRHPDPESVPESTADAEAEVNDLTTRILFIQGELGQRKHDPTTDPNWRRRANDAIAHMSRRRRFLKVWIADQRRAEFTARRDRPRFANAADMSPTAMAKEVARRTSLLEAVYVASVRLFDDDSDENWTEWEGRVERAREVLGEGRSIAQLAEREGETS